MEEVIIGDKNAADYLNIKSTKVSTLRQKGIIPYKNIRGKIYFSKNDLAKLINNLDSNNEKRIKKNVEYDMQYMNSNSKEIKDQNRISYLKNKYNLTIDDYNEMIVLQKSGCAICGKTIRLVIDHNHSTGKVRGLLCNNCNMAIGLMADNSELLRIAAEYIKINVL